jgi:hypothetical protein
LSKGTTSDVCSITGTEPPVSEDSSRRRRPKSTSFSGGRLPTGSVVFVPQVRLANACNFIGSNAPIPEDPPVHRRSISFSDDNTDLESSFAFPRRSRHDSSMSPLAAARSLANRFSFRSSSVTAADTIWTAKTNYAWDTRLLFKRRITNLYILLTSLRSYVEINHSGFRKVLKK